MTDISPTYHHLDTWSGYNPLKFVDPTGERQVGWSPSTYYYEQMARLVVLKEQYRVYEVAMASTWLLMDYISNCVFSQGPNAMGCGGSGNHGGGTGGGSSSDGPTVNGNGDGNPLNTNSSNSNGRPGSSKDNPISANNLTEVCNWHYCFGEGQPLYVDASTIDFSFLSKGNLNHVNDNVYTINLFSFPYMFLSDQLSMALGQITLTCVGDNMYEIWSDKYNFDVKHGEYFSSWRNFATSVGGVLHGGINEPTFLLYPATYWGGEFDIIFVNRVYIKP
jgi:hypothetical protein